MPQKLKFADLYRNNRRDVEKTLSSMWCGEANNESQKAYQKQIAGLIPEIFAPADAMPLVQCMNNYEPVLPANKADAYRLAGNLWQKCGPKGKDPYEHQYQCWKTLLSDKAPGGGHMSMCVTTGTGSGKTECFMLPLVSDLLANPMANEVQAIFIYPLNALMEDQKARLEQLLEGTGLRYAVYNADLPQKELQEGDSGYEKNRRKIDAIRGIKRDPRTGKILDIEFKHAIYTREMLRDTPANILLTNPTMLEYIMLRRKDKKLIRPRQAGQASTLRWIVLDETHTYTGAGATEIAMLLRRVLLAYGAEPGEVRFATSSATIGGSDDEKKAELRKFIADITGLKQNQLRVIDGKRKGMEKVPARDKAFWDKLINHNNDGYLRLDELIEDGASVEEKLELLDEICSRAEAEGCKDLHLKTHFFYRVPNHGLFADISDPRYALDGSFKLLSGNPPRNDDDPNKAPLLELSRCKRCGEYLAIAEGVNNDDGSKGFKPIETDDSDMFDLDAPEDSGKTYYVFATSNRRPNFDNNVPYIIKGSRMLNVTMKNSPAPDEWKVIANVQCQCPYCGASLMKSRKKDDDSDENDELQIDEENFKKLQKFRIAADFVSRLLAPSTLDLMAEGKAASNDTPCLHDGQQYISFVDSRQTAARSTIQQNLEEERRWVYGTIYDELNRRVATDITKDEARKLLSGVISTAPSGNPEWQDALTKLNILSGSDEAAISDLLRQMKNKDSISWAEIRDLLLKDPMADVFCRQFAERSETSQELKPDGSISEQTKEKYILAIMVEYLSRRPLTAAAPETMGLFTSYYAELDKAAEDGLPAAVKSFNSNLSPENQIDQKDWVSLMQIFMDYTVRSNQSVFLKMKDDDPNDIFKCVRFATRKAVRRPAKKPVVKKNQLNASRIIRLIAALIARELNVSIGDAISGYGTEIQSVIDCMWEQLTKTYGLLEHSTHYDEGIKAHAKDSDEIIDDQVSTPYRLNLAKLGFKLYGDVYLCDANPGREKEINHVKWLRPVGVSFHGYSPYLVCHTPAELDESLHESWEPYPFYERDEKPDDETIEEWAREKRKLLWDNGLWGENGTFAIRLLKMHKPARLFVQAEHTAQVDKLVSRQTQEEFKDHRINILACSTTMEMGVDLGSLELVMMSSVPPMPSNYKQRAGRSGRREQFRSACITLCGSDAVGIRTLLDPMANVVLRTANTPAVDWKSDQIIQRHVNAYLIRKFEVFTQAGGDSEEHVLSYYTNYVVNKADTNRFQLMDRKAGNKLISPQDGLGSSAGTPYDTFNDCCANVPSQDLKSELEKLIRGTKLEAGGAVNALKQAREMNERCYDELAAHVQEYADPYKNAVSDKQKTFFLLKFCEPLAALLIGYWATHRFTPNANMPVDVVEFDINTASRRMLDFNSLSNPSYPLRTALSQYAPGNSVAIDGIVRIVRGVRYTNFFKPQVTFKKLYHNRERVVIDRRDELSSLEPWSVSGTPDLDLLQPAEFIPDVNESASRILERNVYTRVRAQLIEAGEWGQDCVEPHLFDARSSKESGSGKILYYNEGTGFGYCHCTKCGKTVLEKWAADNRPKLPDEMNDVPSSDPSKPDYHYSLMRGGNNKPVRCMGCQNDDYIKRNVVLGDTLQTDYTEIRIRHANQGWIDEHSNEKKLLKTLGLLFARSLAEELNIERNDIDFAITPNGSICVFDTNPGGSGYSNQLREIDLLKAVINRSYDILLAAQKSGSKDALIDKFTLHYIDDIDVDAAKLWIEEERKSTVKLPAVMTKLFGDSVVESSLSALERMAASSSGDIWLFAGDDYDSWRYEACDHCWRDQFLGSFAAKGSQITFCVAENSDSKVVLQALSSLKLLKAWVRQAATAKNPFAGCGIYPLAHIDGRLFFTCDAKRATLDDSWGSGAIYQARTGNFALAAKPVNTDNDGSKMIEYINEADPAVIDSDRLGELVESKVQLLFDTFAAHCKANPDETLKIVCMDEHIKTVYSMMINLQVIRHFIRKLKQPFTLEFIVEEYNDNSSGNSLMSCQPSHYERDGWLQSMAENMVADMKNEGIPGSLTDVESLKKGVLPHDRKLILECRGLKLIILPHGGFANDWELCKRNNRYFDINHIKYGETMKIEKRHNIMIAAELG